MPLGFPATPVLDDFNRADGVASGWLGDPDGAAQPDITIVSNQVGGVANAWGVLDVPAQLHSEAYCSFPTWTSSSAEVETAFSGYGTAAFSYYFISALTGGGITVGRASGGVFTELATNLPLGFAAGDSLGIRFVAGLVTGYHKVGSGDWQIIYQAVDPQPLTTPGRPAMYIANSGTRADNFGGGAVPPDAGYGRLIRRRRRRDD